MANVRVKLFRSPDIRLLERELNAWFEENNWVKLINITQSSSDKGQ